MIFKAPIGIINAGDFENAKIAWLEIRSSAAGTFMTVSEHPVVDDHRAGEFAAARAMQAKLSGTMTPAEFIVRVHHIEDMAESAGYTVERLPDDRRYTFAYRLVRR